MKLSAITDSEFLTVELRSVLGMVVGTLVISSIGGVAAIDVLLVSVRACSGIEEFDWLEDGRRRKTELETDGEM